MTEQLSNDPDGESAAGTPTSSPSPSSQSSGGPSSGERSAKAGSLNPMAHPSRTIRPHGTDGSRKLAAAAIRVAIDNKAKEVAVLDVCGQSSEFDLFVLATGQSRRQLHAISEQIDDVLEKDLGDKRMGIEGYDESRWIVLDYGSVVIHLFDEETREYYDLESLWADGKQIPLSELGIEDES